MSEGVFSRRMIFCDNLLTKYKAADLYKTCNCCKLFVCICCADSSKPKLCHHYPVVFIDGACSRNGSDGAFSGIGGLFGEEPAYQWSLPVDGIDPVLVRTSQRAELLAAITGVDRLGEYLLDQRSNDSIWKPAHNGSLAEMVVATDSEYVCKGVTEWMPKWKVCNCFFSTDSANV
jgi:ribonuclease HI